MDMSITDSSDARADAGAMEDNTDPDPEVPERARGAAVLGEVQGANPR